MRHLFFTLMIFSATLSFSQVQNYQLERSDTVGTDQEFITTDPSSGVRAFVSRDSIVNLLFGSGIFYDQTYTAILDGDTTSNQFPNEIEVNVVRAINNDSIVLFLDTLSYNSSPDYVLGLHNVAVTDTVIRGTVKLVPRADVGALDLNQGFQVDLFEKNLESISSLEDSVSFLKKISWAAITLVVGLILLLLFDKNKK